MEIGDLVRIKRPNNKDNGLSNYKFYDKIGIIVDNLNLGLFNETPSYVVQWNGVNEPTIFSGLMLEVVCK
jgi:hypothetical protein